jgi:hypothetical protein
MSDSEKSKSPLGEALRKARGHKFSDKFWNNVAQSINEENKRFTEQERRLRPSWEMMHRPFDI